MFRALSLKGVFAKMKGGIGLRRKIIDGDRYTNLTSICCVYKEKTTHTEYKFSKLQLGMDRF